MDSKRPDSGQSATGAARGLKHALSESARSAPGERFQCFYDRKQAWVKQHPTGSKVAFVLALLLTGFSVLAIVLPLVPGGAVALPAGLALLASHFLRLAQYLDRAEVRLRKSLCRRLGERRWLACNRLVKA